MRCYRIAEQYINYRRIVTSWYYQYREQRIANCIITSYVLWFPPVINVLWLSDAASFIFNLSCNPDIYTNCRRMNSEWWWCEQSSVILTALSQWSQMTFEILASHCTDSERTQRCCQTSRILNRSRCPAGEQPNTGLDNQSSSSNTSFGWTHPDSSTAPKATNKCFITTRTNQRASESFMYKMLCYL